MKGIKNTSSEKNYKLKWTSHIERKGMCVHVCRKCQTVFVCVCVRVFRVVTL